MQAAVALSSPAGDWLVTHAGLTQGYWQKALGEPPSAALAAKAMNSFIGTEHEPVLLHGGVMIEGRVDRAAGPVWAEAGAELVSSWAFSALDLPFNQVHGHSSLYAWDRRRWLAAPGVGALAELDKQRRHVIVRIGDRQLIGVDPGLGHRGGVPWEPLILIGARVL